MAYIFFSIIFSSLFEECVDVFYPEQLFVEWISTNYVGMGGTYQVDDWNTEPSASDRKYILESLPDYLPSLKVSSLLNLLPTKCSHVNI